MSDPSVIVISISQVLRSIGTYNGIRGKKIYGNLCDGYFIEQILYTFSGMRRKSLFIGKFETNGSRTYGLGVKQTK